MPDDKLEEHVHVELQRKNTTVYALVVSFATAACTTGSEAQRCSLVGGVSVPLVRRDLSIIKTSEMSTQLDGWTTAGILQSFE